MNAFDRLMRAGAAPPGARTVTYSEEQRAVVEALFPTGSGARTHVTVDAVAGSGKTTTIGAVLERFRQRYPSERALVIMYNKVLQLETEARLGSTGALIYTLHAAAGRCAGGRRVFRDDTALSEYIDSEERETEGENCLPACSLLVFDEMRDATPLFVRTLRWMIGRLGVRHLLFLGDVRQCINTYTGADPRFLVHADEVFGDLVSGPWVRKTLTTSYRCLAPVCDFMNRCLLGGKDRFRPGRPTTEHVPVTYVHLDPTAALADLVRRITSLHRVHGVALEAMAVLMPAVRSTASSAPCARVANALTDAGFKVVTSAEAHEERTLKGKILISSIHQFKGREREIIFLPQFDARAAPTGNGLTGRVPSRLKESRRSVKSLMRSHTLRRHGREHGWSFITQPAILRFRGFE